VVTRSKRAVGTANRPRVARDRHSAVAAAPKALMWSRDRGHKVHRILRRVPTGRRHPGSIRGEAFHEAALSAVLAGIASSDPNHPFERRTFGQEQRSRRRARREMNEVRRQGCQRLDRTPMPWEENAHARLSRSRDSRGREQHRRRIRRSGLGGRENLRSPGHHCTAPERPCRIPAAKVAQGAGNTTRCGCTQFVWVADIVWTHRVSSPPSLRKKW